MGISLKATVILLITACIMGIKSAGIRKCCPKGMLFGYLNETVKVCQEWPLQNLDFPLHNEFGVAVSPSGHQSPDIIEVDALMMCSHGRPDKLIPELGDCFTILPNGSLFVTRHPIGEQISDEYCVDYELNEDGVQSLIGMICLPPSEVESLEQTSLILIIYPYLLFASSAFLVATFIVYAIIPELRNIHGMTIMCHVASLAVTYIGIGMMQTMDFVSNAACISIGVVTHYAFLSAFTWLSVMSFDIWWVFRDLQPTLDRPGRVARRHTGKRIITYFIYAWTVPLIIVMTGVILDYNSVERPIEKCWFENEEERQSYLSNSTEMIRPRFGEGSCWFQGKDPSMIVYLYGPIGILIILNIIFFILTVNALYEASVDTTLAAGKHKTKQQFRVIFCIFILMGLSWTFELVSYAAGGNPLNWILTDVINILINGVVIFVLFVCKATVWRHLTSKFPFLKKLNTLWLNRMK